MRMAISINAILLHKPCEANSRIKKKNPNSHLLAFRIQKKRQQTLTDVMGNNSFESVICLAEKKRKSGNP